tara:strand:- start:6923 stop:7321 length:399 start_codon:yes stop_codon:yes gene_type:complete
MLLEDVSIYTNKETKSLLDNKRQENIIKVKDFLNNNFYDQKYKMFLGQYDKDTCTVFINTFSFLFILIFNIHKYELKKIHKISQKSDLSISNSHISFCNENYKIIDLDIENNVNFNEEILMLLNSNKKINNF